MLKRGLPLTILLCCFSFVCDGFEFSGKGGLDVQCQQPAAGFREGAQTLHRVYVLPFKVTPA